MTLNKIGKFEAVCLVLISILNHIILQSPRDIIKLTATSSILNIIFVSIVGFIFCVFIVKCFSRFANYDILDISEFLGGKFLKYIVGALFLVFCVVASGSMLRAISEILKITYLGNSEIWIIAFVFVIATAIANYFGGNSIIKTNMIIVPVMIFTIIITFIFCISGFHIQNMFPILGYGVKETFLIGISNIFAFSGIGILYFLPPLLKENLDFKKVAYISYTITAVLLILSIACILFFISSIFAIEELSPMYLLTRTANFGDFVERPEALFILFWILAFISYLSVITMIAVIIMRKLFRLENKKISTLIFSPFVFLVAIIPKNMSDVTFLSSTIYKYFSLGLLFGFIPIVLFFAYFKKKRVDKFKAVERRNM